MKKLFESSPIHNPLNRFRPWFYAAAIYNLVWGCLTIFRPNWQFELFAIPQPQDTSLWQVVGMFVLVYAPAYWWAGRQPVAHRHFIVIGMMGKLLGPIGFVWSVINGRLPLAFGWVILMNDVIWWPAFMLFLRDAADQCGGFGTLLRGD